MGGVPPGLHIYLKYKAGFENKVTDALSRCVMILLAMSAEVTGFERLKDEYESCPDFGEICHIMGRICSRDKRLSATRWYLFRFRMLCISRTSLRNFLS